MFASRSGSANSVGVFVRFRAKLPGANAAKNYECGQISAARFDYPPGAWHEEWILDVDAENENAMHTTYLKLVSNARCERDEVERWLKRNYDGVASEALMDLKLKSPAPKRPRHA